MRPLAKRHGARLIIVNRDPSGRNDHADLVLNAGIGPLMNVRLALMAARH